MRELGLPSEEPATSINLLEIPLPQTTSIPPPPPPPPPPEPQTSAPSKASRVPRGSNSRSQKRSTPQTVVRGAHWKFARQIQATENSSNERQMSVLTTTVTTQRREGREQLSSSSSGNAGEIAMSSVVVVYQPPPPVPFELTPPTPTEINDCIIIHCLLRYLHMHSRSVIEYETRRHFLMEQYRPKLIAFVELEMRAASSLSYKNLDLIVSKCARILE